jgi:hypothetical protein
MKTLKELRGNLDLKPTEIASSVKYFAGTKQDAEHLKSLE